MSDTKLLNAHGASVKFSILMLLILSFSLFAEEKLDCEKAWTTIDVNRCMSIDLAEVEKVMEKYLAKSLERYKEDKVSLKSIEESQDLWLTYRNSHCGAVYDTWRDGTIRTSMGLGCKIDLTQQRTKKLWLYFLTYMDSTPAILPEPKPYKPKSY